MDSDSFSDKFYQLLEPLKINIFCSYPWGHLIWGLSSVVLIWGPPFCCEFSSSPKLLRQDVWYWNFRYIWPILSSFLVPPSILSLVAAQKTTWPSTSRQPALRNTVSFWSRVVHIALTLSQCAWAWCGYIHNPQHPGQKVGIMGTMYTHMGEASLANKVSMIILGP